MRVRIVRSRCYGFQQKRIFIIVLLMAACISLIGHAQAASDSDVDGLAPVLFADAAGVNSDTQPQGLSARSRWSLNFGVGTIGDTSAPKDYLILDFDPAEGAGSGRTYNFTVTYRLHEFDWRSDKLRLQPQLEIPVMLSLIDDRSLGLFPDYNAGLLLRWRDWPWNRHLYTTFAIGVGASYSSKVWTADRQRHANEERAHLKFWMPIELTFALPRSPQHQLTLFIDHQSGGHITDEGGVDAWGFGYRYLIGR